MEYESMYVCMSFVWSLPAAGAGGGYMDKLKASINTIGKMMLRKKVLKNLNMCDT